MIAETGENAKARGCTPTAKHRPGEDARRVWRGARGRRPKAAAAVARHGLAMAWRAFFRRPRARRYPGSGSRGLSPQDLLAGRTGVDRVDRAPRPTLRSAVTLNLNTSLLAARRLGEVDRGRGLLEPTSRRPPRPAEPAEDGQALSPALSARCVPDARGAAPAPHVAGRLRTPSPPAERVEPLCGAG